MTSVSALIPEPLEKLLPMQLSPLDATPLVSVLIANYNYGRFIGAAIESVLKQTYQVFEICICDDGSSDDSREIITGSADRDSRIKQVFNPNGGVGSALNTAWGIATGQLIALLDADDVWLQEKLSKTVQCFRANPNVGLVVHPLKQV